MSFFAKYKPPNGPKRVKYTNNGVSKKRKAKSKPVPPVPAEDEEITSSEDEDAGQPEADAEISPSEDEIETAQEKKLRLAKLYLEEIERQERERQEDKEIDKDVFSKRLKEDYLKQIGRYRSREADKYKGVELENVTTLKCREHNNAITCLCISLNDQYLYSGSKDAGLVKWCLKTGKKILSMSYVKNNAEIMCHRHRIMSIAVSSDDKFLVVSDESNDVQIWNPSDFNHIHTLKGHRDAVVGVCFKRDTHTLYTCSKDKSVKVWSLDEMSYVETLYGHQGIITSIDTLYRDRVVTSGGRDSTVRVWKIPEESQLIYNGSGCIDFVKLINEEHFITAGDDGNICVWSSLKKKPICTVEKAHGIDPSNGQPYWIVSLASLLNTDLFASGSSNGSVKLWKLGDGFKTVTLLYEVPVIGFVNAMVFTSDGDKLIVSTAKEHRFGRWDVIKAAKNVIRIIPLLK